MEDINKTEPRQEPTHGKTSRRYLWFVGLFTFAGVVAGYAYYAFIGCKGGCPLQSSPYLSMIWGGALGYLLPGIVINPKKEKEKEEK